MIIERRVERGPISVNINGWCVATECDVVSVQDIRETVIGSVNFGYVTYGSLRIVEVEARQTIARGYRGAAREAYARNEVLVLPGVQKIAFGRDGRA